MNVVFVLVCYHCCCWNFLNIHWNSIFSALYAVLPVVLEQQVVVMPSIALDDQIESVVDEDFVSMNRRSLSNNITSSVAYTRQANHMGKSWIANSNLIWNKQFPFTPKTLTNSSTPGRIAISRWSQYLPGRSINVFSQGLVWFVKMYLIRAEMISAKYFLSHFNYLLRWLHMEDFISARRHKPP